MKTIKLLFATTLLFCCTFVPAQTTMTKAIERYLIANGQIESMEKSMTPALIQVHSLMNIDTPHGYDAESLAYKYAKSQLLHDIASAIAPYVIDQNVSASEINVLSAMLETSEGKLATRHSQQVNSDENLADMMAVVQRDIVSISQTGTYQKISVNTTTERYRLFMSYYRSCGVDKLIAPLIKSQLQGQVSDEIMRKIENYFHDNLPILMYNASGQMTINDLRFYKRLCDKPQYDRLIKGVSTAINNPQQLGMTIFTKYSEWVGGLRTGRITK